MAVFVLFGALLPATPAKAQDILASPRAACLDAVREAERAHGLPEGLLVAMALNESGLHAYALNIGGRAHFPSNREDARRLLASAPQGTPVMVGCVQVNTRVHARNGQEWPLDPRRAANWAARYLRSHYEQTGDWSSAVVRWHGGSARIAHQIICRIRGKLDVTAPHSTLFAERRCDGGTEAARRRRSGQALLELAEASER